MLRCTFSAWFSSKNVPYLILYQWTNIQCHTFFSFLRYQTKCLIKLLLSQLMMSQTLRFISDQLLKQWLTERKRGEDENRKILISREGKELFRWTKKHFSEFLKGYHLLRNKNLIKNSGLKLQVCFSYVIAWDVIWNMSDFY